MHLSSSDVWKAATEPTTVALKVPYNINFTANAVAVNCAGSGVPAQLETINIGIKQSILIVCALKLFMIREYCS